MSNIPSDNVRVNAFKLSIVNDKPIYLNYWTESQNNQVFIGKNPSGEKMIVKDEEEYTSPIEKIYKMDNSYIVMTANSIYIVSVNIQIKQVNLD